MTSPQPEQPTEIIDASHGLYISFYFRAVNGQELCDKIISSLETALGILEAVPFKKGLYKLTEKQTLNRYGIKSFYVFQFTPLLTNEVTAFQLMADAVKDSRESFSKVTGMLNSIYAGAKDVFLGKEFLGYNVLFYLDLLNQTQAVFQAQPLLLDKIISLLPLKVFNDTVKEYLRTKTFMDKDKGNIYLLKLPSSEDASIVYLVTTFKDSARNHLREASIIYEYLAGEKAVFQRMDTFLLKAFLQWNSYKAILEEYQYKLNELNEQTDLLLRSISSHRVVGKSLKEIATKFAKFKSVSWKVERMYISISQQIHGIERLFDGDYSSEIAQFHLKHLASIEQEINALITKSDSTVSTTRLSIEIAEGEQEKNYTAVVTIFGIILTLFQIISDDLIRIFIRRFPILKNHLNETINVFLFKLLISTIIGLILLKTFKFFNRK